MFKTPGRYKEVERFQDVLTVIVEKQLGFFLEYLGLKEKEVGDISEKPTPERIRKVLEDMGGGFVMLGHFLSTRPDLIPARYCNEFSKIKEHEAEPVAPDGVEVLVSKQLGKPWNQVFQSLMLQPESSTMLEQVHKAVLKTGDEVEVRIRKPSSRERLASDIDIMAYLANLIEKNFKPGKFKPHRVVSKFHDYAERQMDYRWEAREIEKLGSHYKNTPEVFAEYTTRDLLVLKYPEGVSQERMYEKVYEKLQQGTVKRSKTSISRWLVSSIAIVIGALSYGTAGLSRGTIFGYPDLAVAGITVSLILLFAVFLSWFEEVIGWN